MLTVVQIEAQETDTKKPPLGEF